VNEENLETMRKGALPTYSNHPKFRPVGQDGGGNGVSPNTIYLTEATTAASTLDEATTESLKTLSNHILETQDKDGSWVSTAKLPPVGDVTEVRTMHALLALFAAHDKGLVENDRWTASRDKALQWLSTNKFVDQNQSWNLRLMVAQRMGKPEEVQAIVKELLNQQEPDGGWSQTRVQAKNLKEYTEDEEEGTPTEKKAAETKDKPAAPKEPVAAEAKDKPENKAPATPAATEKRPSDALATGQTVYALRLAGVAADHPAIQRAQAFLLKTQTKDGSWFVPNRSQKNSGRALTHFGTGWAALGLMQTIPTTTTASLPPVKETK
jgi:hypothetical protein